MQAEQKQPYAKLSDPIPFRLPLSCPPSTYQQLGDWRAVQRGRTWRAAVATAVACAAVAVTLALQRVYAVPWNAPGAPAKEPPSAGLAESLYRLAVMLAAIQATRVRPLGGPRGGRNARALPGSRALAPS